MTTPNIGKRPQAAQAPLGKKAAQTKADNAARVQAAALRNLPDLSNETESKSTAATPSRDPDRQHVHAARAPPGIRLLDKPEVLEITGVTFPTIWAWMRRGEFPRSRIVGGKSMWLSTEVEAWLAALPVRKLKGDAQGKARS